MIDCGPDCMEALKEIERLLDGELRGRAPDQGAERT